MKELCQILKAYMGKIYFYSHADFRDTRHTAVQHHALTATVQLGSGLFHRRRMQIFTEVVQNFFSVVGMLQCSVLIKNAEGGISFSGRSRKTNRSMMTKTHILQVLSKTLVFTMEQNPLHFVCAIGNFLQNPSFLRLGHTSKVESAVHLWRNGNPMRENLTVLIITQVGTSLQLFHGGPIPSTTSHF